MLDPATIVGIVSEMPWVKEILGGGLVAAVLGILGWKNRRQGRKEAYADMREEAAKDYAETRRNIDNAQAPTASDTDYDADAARQRMRDRLG